MQLDIYVNLATLYIYGTEGTHRTIVLTGAAADAALLVHGHGAVSRCRVIHYADGCSRTMT